MLKLEVDGPKTTIAFNGDLVELCRSFGEAINHVYHSLGQRNPDADQAFRGVMTAFFTDPDSPLWTEKINGHGTSICIVQPREDD